MIIFPFPFFPVGWITTYLWDGAVRPSFATKWKAREEVKRDESRYYPSRPARLPFFPPHRWWPFLLIFFFLFLSFTLYLSLSLFLSVHPPRPFAGSFRREYMWRFVTKDEVHCHSTYTGLSRFSIPRNPRILGSMGFRIAVIMAVWWRV